MRIAERPIFWFFTAFLFRLPFLFQGYGVEEDAWGHVLNIYEMLEQERYILSRLPSHPLYEGWLYLMSFININPFTFNLGAALASSWAAMSFFRIYRHYRLPHQAWATLAFQSVPVIWLNGMTTMDYLFALALGLAAWRMVLKDRAVWAGLFLGLGIGFRMSTALWGLPLLLLWKYRTGKPLSKEALWFGATAAVTGILPYLVPYATYGLDFFGTYDLPYPGLSKVLFKGIFGVWGPLGVLALMVGVAAWHRKAEAELLWTALLQIGLTAALFISLPEKSAFLIPAVPFVIIVLGAVSRGRLWRRMLNLMVLSPFAFGINLQDPLRGSLVSGSARVEMIGDQIIAFDPWVGPLAADLSKRWNKADYVDETLYCLSKKQEPQAVIAGWWYAMLEVEKRQREWTAPVEFLYYCPPEKFDELEARKVAVYYLDQQGLINNRKYGNEMATTRAQALTCR